MKGKIEMSIPKVFPDDGFSVVSDSELRNLRRNNEILNDMIKQKDKEMNVDKTNEQLNAAAKPFEDKWTELADLLRKDAPDECIVIVNKGEDVDIFYDTSVYSKDRCVELLGKALVFLYRAK